MTKVVAQNFILQLDFLEIIHLRSLFAEPKFTFL